jgi:hypothetical protein
MRPSSVRDTKVRSFEQLELSPNDHQLDVDQTGAGRADLIEEPRHVLSHSRCCGGCWMPRMESVSAAAEANDD